MTGITLFPSVIRRIDAPTRLSFVQSCEFVGLQEFNAFAYLTKRGLAEGALPTSPFLPYSVLIPTPNLYRVNLEMIIAAFCSGCA